MYKLNMIISLPGDSLRESRAFCKLGYPHFIRDILSNKLQKRLIDMHF
ncbi:hypothetical protein SLEP1_g9702 [Rubroshorea leprosula]|uniref:Uncharacterized protein n=1 Tax=Rubroshorea leprosula TaxID=152421 RepID=A0AAV5IBP8_9ROSI|nr:hypothetical protein SLEP1_g9702 [Rubroshorea leprosula]